MIITITFSAMEAAGISEEGIDSLRKMAVDEDDEGLDLDTDTARFKVKRSWLRAKGLISLAPQPSPVPTSLPGSRRPFGAVPFAEWPRRVRWLSKARREGEKGIGDTLERLYGAAGRFVKKAWKFFGVDCGCDARKAKANAKYPYRLMTQCPFAANELPDD